MDNMTIGHWDFLEKQPPNKQTIKIHWTDPFIVSSEMTIRDNLMVIKKSDVQLAKGAISK